MGVEKVRVYGEGFRGVSTAVGFEESTTNGSGGACALDSDLFDGLCRRSQRIWVFRGVSRN